MTFVPLNTRNAISSSRVVDPAMWGIKKFYETSVPIATLTTANNGKAGPFITYDDDRELVFKRRNHRWNRDKPGNTPCNRRHGCAAT